MTDALFFDRKTEKFKQNLIKANANKAAKEA